MDTMKPAAPVSMRVAAIQMVSTATVETNLAAAAGLIAQAATGGAQLILLPEYFCIMGNTDLDKVKVRETDGDGPIQRFLAEQAKSHEIWLVGGTVPLACDDPGRVYNSTLVYGPDGKRITRYDKIHLFGFRRGDEIYDEAASIVPGSRPVAFDTPCGSVGLSVCYDLRFPELYRALGEVALILVPAAFTYTTGRAHWETLLRARAIENQCYVLAGAQGGVHSSGRRTWGHSMLIDPWGDVLEVHEEGPGLVVGTIQPSRLAEVRTSLPALRHRVM